jgi:hypothetical protein
LCCFSDLEEVLHYSTAFWSFITVKYRSRWMLLHTVDQLGCGGKFLWSTKLPGKLVSDPAVVQHDFHPVIMLAKAPPLEAFRLIVVGSVGLSEKSRTSSCLILLLLAPQVYC